eukprot:5484790-Amphidinium_carterae.1
MLMCSRVYSSVEDDVLEDVVGAVGVIALVALDVFHMAVINAAVATPVALSCRALEERAKGDWQY